MEVSALRHPGLTLRGPTPLLRLQSDERLVTLTRRGNQAAFEALVGRYQARLLAFCRHMLGSREDAEDVLQEVFAAGFNAMVADERPINVRPWLYRIARNRSLNHLRRHQAIGVDSMDVHLAEHGVTTADKVHRREEFRQLIGDVQDLPETQRTALLLREIDALSYDQVTEGVGAGPARGGGAAGAAPEPAPRGRRPVGLPAGARGVASATPRPSRPAGATAPVAAAPAAAPAPRAQVVTQPVVAPAPAEH